ncbi:MAG: type II toxin-antitoxin system Phd/YefM family antitoxin [Bryobacteraceae bacterium]|nr:type II toxin-antitoxin system Phd/YefM family antitoxin [Bryobacteraceae bacterium]
MSVTATQLREDIYQILDRVLENGQPVEILRNGQLLRIVAVNPPSKFSRLVQRDCIVGNPDDLISVDWSHEWKPVV